MTNPNKLAKLSLLSGDYYLIDVDQVIELYRDAGFDVDNEDEEVPNTLVIDGLECFFTGDHVLRNKRYYEIVIAAKDFKWDEVLHDEEDDV